MHLIFTGFLVYCYYRLYFGPGFFPVPFEYLIMGLGLISFAKIIERNMQTSTDTKRMKITKPLFVSLISILLLSGLVIAGLISVQDKEEFSMLINQSPLQVPESYDDASLSIETVLLLLAVGIIGWMGISRKRKGLENPAQNNWTNREYKLQNLNGDKRKI